MKKILILSIFWALFNVVQSSDSENILQIKWIDVHEKMLPDGAVITSDGQIAFCLFDSYGDVVKIDQQQKSKTFFGSMVGDGDYCEHPVADKKGNLWIVDGNKIKRIDDNGKKTVFNLVRDAKTPLEDIYERVGDVNGMVIDSNDTIYGVDLRNALIWKIGNDQKIQWIEIDTSVDKAYFANIKLEEYKLDGPKLPHRFVYSQKYIWFIDNLNNRIARLGIDGKLVFFKLMQKDENVALNGMNMMNLLAYVFSQNDNIGITDINILGLSSDLSGNVWFTRPLYNKVGFFKADGAVKEFDVPKGYSFPVDIGPAPDNKMWFTLPKNKKLASIDIKGNTKIYSSPTLDGLIGSVYLDRENNLWVSQLSFKGLEREILRSDECGITIPACIFRFGKVTGQSTAVKLP